MSQKDIKENDQNKTHKKISIFNNTNEHLLPLVCRQFQQLNVRQNDFLQKRASPFV